jgi:hypothetical protein
MIRGLTSGSFIIWTFFKAILLGLMRTFSVWNFTGGLEGLRFGILRNFDVEHVAPLKARAPLGWSEGDLAMNSGVSVPTVKRREAAIRFFADSVLPERG